MKGFFTGFILVLLSKATLAQLDAMKNNYPLFDYTFNCIRFNSYVVMNNLSIWNYFHARKSTDFQDTITVHAHMIELVNGLLHQRLNSLYPDQPGAHYLTKIMFYRNKSQEIVAWGNYRYTKGESDRRYLSPQALGSWTGIFDAAPGDFGWFKIQLQFPYIFTIW